MKFLKCVTQSVGTFVTNNVYPVVKEIFDTDDDRIRYFIIDEHNIETRVPLKGMVWEFEEVEISVDQMYFNHSKNKDVMEDLIQAAILAGLDEWPSVEDYECLIGFKHKDDHCIFYEAGIGVNGVDSGNVEMHKPEGATLYEVSGATFLQAFREEVKKLAEKKATPSPRFRKPRQPVPKRTTVSAKIYYVDGSGFTVKNVTQLNISGGSVSFIRDKFVEKGIKERILNTIDQKLIRNIVINTPDQKVQVEHDFFIPGSWNIYDGKDMVAGAKVVDLNF